MIGDLKRIIEEVNKPSSSLGITSIKINGPILRIVNFENGTATVYVDNVSINGIFEEEDFFVDADQMNIKCSFIVDKRKVSDKGIYLSVPKEAISVKSVYANTKSAGGTINWSYFSVQPRELASDLKSVKSLFRSKVTEYFSLHKEELVEDLNKILPSTITLIKHED